MQQLHVSTLIANSNWSQLLSQHLNIPRKLPMCAVFKKDCSSCDWNVQFICQGNEIIYKRI